MSQFYGTLQGTRGKATRTGGKASGVRVQAASWAGCVEVYVYEDADGKEKFVVEMNPWQGRGERRTLASGEVGKAGSVRLGA